MKHALISSCGSDRVLLVFAGWAMDPNVFSDLRCHGYDIMVVWDYTTLHIDWSCVADYSEVCILAWSMGVYAASHSTHAIDYKITRCVAVGGTPEPIHDLDGIPEATFYATLDNLTERSLAKFFRRMSASSADHARFMANPPARTLDDVRAELQAIADSTFFNVPAGIRWDIAYIGRDDRIFPMRNQLHAWHAADVETRILDCGHYPDFNALTAANFVDKHRMQERFAGAPATYDAHATVQREVIDRLVKDAADFWVFKDLARHPYLSVLEIGSGSGLLSARLASLLPRATLTLWDISAPMPRGLDTAAGRIHHRLCDAEAEIRTTPSNSFHAIFSASTMQWFNSPRSFLEECRRTLCPGGWLVISTFTRGNMRQITDITGSTLPLLTPEAMLEMSREYFRVECHHAWERDLDFDTPVEVLRHLRQTGVNSLEGSGFDVVRRYPMMLDGRYHLTYTPMTLILQKQ